MRISRIRFTVRRMMVLVLLLALASHLGVTAWKVRWYRRGHVHTGYLDEEAFPAHFFFTGQKQAFWPSFWRESMGLSQKDLRTCWVGGRAVADVCELDHPEIVIRGPGGSLSCVSAPAQDEAYIGLLREKGRTVTLKDGRIWVSMPTSKTKK